MRYLIIGFLMFLSPSVYAQGKAFTVSGKISGLDSKVMHITYTDLKGNRVRDSIAVNNGTFNFTSKDIGEMSLIPISPNVERTVKRAGRGYYPVKSSLLQFIAYPGANVKFYGNISDFADAYPSGDAANNDLAKLNRAIYPLMNESVNLQVKVANKIITDSTMVREANQRMKQLDDHVLNIKKAFVRQNSSSVAAAWMLADMMLRNHVSNEEATGFFEKLNRSKLKSTTFYEDVSKRVAGIRATAIGKPAPEINSMHTYDGKRFTLASLKGKYVVIDFWGTWCGPCIAGMPKMKEYLDKYKNKMEILGVAQESDDGTRWRGFLDKNQTYQWHHVLSRNDDNLILKYSVAGFPTKIIVDPEGKIVARFVGEDEAIYEKMDKLFK